MRNCPILYMVIPCYNEEEVLPVTCEIFLNKIKNLISAGKISDDSKVMFRSEEHTSELQSH